MKGAKATFKDSNKRRKQTVTKGSKEKLMSVLPIKIDTLLCSIAEDPRTKGKCRSMVNTLFSMYAKEGLLFDEPKQIPCSLLKKTFGENYIKSWRIIQELGIIQTDDYYTTYNHECKSYHLNLELIDDNFKTVSYEAKVYKDQQNEPIQKKTRSLLKNLRVPIKEVRSYINDYAASEEAVHHLKFDDQITETYFTLRLPSFEIRDKHFPSFKGGSRSLKCECSIRTARKIAASEGLTLIQDKRKFYLQDKTKYLRLKRQHIFCNYYRSARLLYNKQVRANRNSSNLRLDTNLTNMPGILLSFFKIDGQHLVNIDLKNSQFLILAWKLEKYLLKPLKLNDLEKSKCVSRIFHLDRVYINKYKGKGGNVDKNIEIQENFTSESSTQRTQIDLESNEGTNRLAYMCVKSTQQYVLKNAGSTDFTEGLSRFVELAKSGQLYEYIQDNLYLSLGDQGRKEAKRIMFEIFFSKHKNYTSSKNKLKELFPFVIYLIDEFKKEFGDNQFAIELQLIESHLFIDTILNTLLEQGYTVFSKHDSILCREMDLNRVEGVVRSILDRQIGIDEYQLHIE